MITKKMGNVIITCGMLTALSASAADQISNPVEAAQTVDSVSLNYQWQPSINGVVSYEMEKNKIPKRSNAE